MGFVLAVVLVILLRIDYGKGFQNAQSLGKIRRIKCSAENELRRTESYLSMNQNVDVVERRKKRRGKVPFETIAAKPVAQTPPKSNSQPLQSNGGSKLEEGLESFAEKLIGLKDDQLRDLMELELPVPQEDKATGKVVEGEDAGSKVFRLPELRDFLQDTSSKDVKQEQPADLFVPLNSPKVNRRNFDEYQEFLRKNPYADSDERYFTEEFDIIPSIFGSGKLLGIGVSYLQAGHLIFLFIALVSAFLYSPGNPLTDLPNEIRTFLKQGLVVVYGINAVLAGQAYFIAKGKNLPAVFWLVKTFLFGGLSFYEVKQTEDPMKFASFLQDERMKREKISKKKKRRNESNAL